MSHLHDLSGEKKDQILITVDTQGNPLGTNTREACHTLEGITHLAFLAFLFDGKGNVYLQKRSGKKSLWDGYWDASIVSHVLPGETVEEATRRRGKEELGVDTSFNDIGAFYYHAKYNTGHCENEFCHVLLGKTIGKVIPNPIEISDLRLISYETLLKEFDTDPSHFTPWLTISLQKYREKLQ